MKKRLFTLLATASLMSMGQAQSISNTLDEPTLAELSMTRYDPDTTASAVVLCDRSVTQFSDLYTIDYNRKVRIKILTAEGLNHLDKTVSGKVYNLVDGQVTNANADQIKVGSVIDYEYHHESKDYLTIEPWCPQRAIPVRSATFSLITPVNYKVSFDKQGNVGVHNYANDTIDYQDSNDLKCKAYRRDFEVRYVNAMPDDEHIYNMDEYRMKMKPYIDSIPYINGQLQDNALTWEKVDLQLYDSELIKKFLMPTEPLGKRAKELEEQGYDVYPILIRRRSSGLIDFSHPSVDAFNDIVFAITPKLKTKKGHSTLTEKLAIAMRENNKNYNLTCIDPTLPDSMMQYLPVDKRVTYARLLDITYDNVIGRWINIFASTDYRKVSTVALTLDQDGRLTGKKETYYRNLATFDHDVDKIEESINKQYVMRGDSVEFSPFFPLYENEIIPDSTRTLPFDYPYCYVERHIITIDIDESFEIDDIPTQNIFVSSTKSFGCFFKLQQKDNKVEIAIEMQRNVMTMLPSSFTSIHHFFESIREKCEEKIVVKKREE